MPREGAERRWEVDKKPLDEWYAVEDPWHIRTDPDELKKTMEILKHLRNEKYGIGMDMGCGEGFFTEMYADHCDLMLGCDISNVAIRRARKNHRSVNFFQWDIRKGIPNLKNKLDLIICSEVLYYLPPEDCRKVAKNIYGMLKPGGHLIICLTHYYLLKDLYDMFKEIDWNTMTNFDYKDDYTLIIGGKYVPKKKV